MRWFESSPIHDLLIKNNRFLNGTIAITTSVKAKSVKGLRVEGNRSVESALPVQPGTSCTDIVVKDNVVVAP